MRNASETNNFRRMLALPALAVLIILCASAAAGPGGEFWEKKEYKQWSQKECAKLLEDSPWSRLYPLTMVGILDSTERELGSASASQPYVNYHVQFRSALPIRQAIVRQNQIASKYDSLLPEQQQEFDKNAEAFLSGFPSDIVVVNLTYSTNNRIWDQEAARYWQSQTVDMLKNSTYLSGSKGDKVPIAKYVAAQGAQRSSQFIFPREVNGKPILDSKDKSLTLEFSYPVFRGVGDGRISMEFKVQKMIFEGNIAY